MTLDEVAVGQRAEVSSVITESMIDAFAALSGDTNPVHLDAAAARTWGLPQRVAHGCLTLSLLSALIGTRLPGEGALWQTVDVEWVRAVLPGDTVVVTGEVTQKSVSAGSVVIRAEARNQAGTVVMRATALVSLLARPGDPAVDSLVPAPGPAPTVATSAAGAAAPSRRVVLVTGGSRGIGRAIAVALGRAGFAVAVGFHRSRLEAEAVGAEIRAGGAAAMCVQLDVRGPLDLGTIDGTLGAPVALVHAATPPLAHRKLGEAGLEEDLDEYLTAYVRAPLRIVRRMEPAMSEARWGRVILLGTSAILGAPPAHLTAYVTAKSALLGMARSLAVELGPAGVTVNVVSPGLTVTDLTRDVSPRARLGEAQRTPMRRLAQPDDAAALCAFLMSDAAGFVSGAHLPVTGGLAMA